ncbi:hypothetical protein Hs30E_18330 [Lactococcus hodotermopsidis]|uniref:Uncharacterized protein n=1 Tax=Pseudolactococcus hodotermopsidis TaxID=2709157 RepID=A0A6A0BD03_9LACT|nr:hypothetical protein [Lactococcus hodotermopsidis]GFH43282.1 hypothetical protein Hs30E_18330 [Lactococcus hodotermopsidis]
MLYENTLGNPFLDIDFMNNQLIETMKTQERIAIAAILMAKRIEITAQGTSLSQSLSEKKTEMVNFASQTIVSNFKEGLSGQSAVAAEERLKTSSFQPDLKSPMK